MEVDVKQMLKFLAVEKKPLAEMQELCFLPPPPHQSQDLLTAHFLTESGYYCYFSWLNIEIDRKKWKMKATKFTAGGPGTKRTSPGPSG